MKFTHYWVTGFGWENTIFQPEDFEKVKVLGENDKDGTVFICSNKVGTSHIIKGTK